MPQLGETVSEGMLSVWRKRAGDAVAAGEILFEVETDKVATEIPSLVSGTLREILVEEGAVVAVGARLAVIETAGETLPAASGARAPAATGDDRLSPAVKRLLAEHAIDASAVQGTGRAGRIQRKDVIAYIERRKATAGGGPRAVPLSALRKRVGAHMVRSKATSPHVLQAVEADFSRIERTRTAANRDWRSREGFSLTYLPFVAKAVTLALADFPNVNGRIDGDSLVVYPRVNLAIAVDLGFQGLVAPVVKDAGARNVAELARAIHALAQRARETRLRPDDLTEGTYSISSNGGYGTLFTAAIINQPQVAILSTDGVKKRPVVVEDEAGDRIVIRPVGILAQSFDHRAFDGAYSAAFLRRLKEVIEAGLPLGA